MGIFKNFDLVSIRKSDQTLYFIQLLKRRQICKMVLASKVAITKKKKATGIKWSMKNFVIQMQIFRQKLKPLELIGQKISESAY